MMNAEEHKKLLEQIAEFERNSINYFDVEKEFFLIDSNNLSQIRPRLYGYSIQRSGIYEDDDLTPEAIAGLDGRGCYVYVEVKDGKITIKQDLNGSWGIYLFRHGDYFALSNSFFRLLDYVKFKYPLTVNIDYCHYLMINNVSSHSYFETAVNEIQLVERNTILQIDIKEKVFQKELIDYKEHSISVDSEEGVAILDSWVDFWGSVLRGITQHTKFLQASLSGGFDTRISLTLLLNSGIDLNKIRIDSFESTVHTFEEDFAIASQIANHFNFKLNQAFPAREGLLSSINDIFNLNLYTTQTFSNLQRLFGRKSVYKTYSLDGTGGETIRGNWLRFDSLKNFMEIQKNLTEIYSRALADKLFNSVKVIIDSAFSIIRDKYKIEDPDSLWLAQYLYHETRCRHHFGKGSAYGYLANNNISFSPVFDPKIRTLRFNTVECPDHQLLIALLFTRYAPDLLEFPFQGKRFIVPETIAYAQKINERFPRKVTADKSDREEIFYLQPRNLQAEKILAKGKNNPNIPKGLPEACLRAMFESSRTYGLFNTYFNEELYRYAVTYYDDHVFGRFRPLYSIVGVTRVLEDVEISQRKHSPYQDMQRFIEQDYCKITEDYNSPIVDKFKLYFKARIDVKLLTKEQGDFQIFSVSDGRASMWKPGWFQKGGVGYQIQSYAGRLEFVAKPFVEGKIRFKLTGLDIRDPKDDSKRVPYWIDYTKLIVNGKTILDKLTPAWHDKPYTYIVDAKANEEITINVEWLPHRSDT